MAILSSNEISRILNTSARIKLTVDSYSIDSRTPRNGKSTLFFAIKTTTGDGHRFIPELIGRGVRNFVVNTPPSEEWPGVNFFVVDDVIEAMQRLAKFVRDKFSGEVIAITGSRGKTVLKEWLIQFLPGDTYSSPRSFNSQIGVALSILQAPLDANRWIIEAGISRRGEMERLATIIRPDFAILTNITAEHSDGFSSREEQYAQKSILLKGLSEDKTTDGETAKLSLREVLKDVLLKNGIETDEERIDHLIPALTRINVVDGINGMTILHDAFTNNLQSLLPALDFAHRRRAEDRPFTLLLANENSAYSTDCIRELQKMYDITQVITAEGADEAIAELRKLDLGGQLLLVKGSDKSGFERVVAEFEQKQHETVMEVNLDNLVSNFNFFKSRLPENTGICVMLKADGYGCGSLEPARTLQSQGAAAIAVAVVDEGVKLRKAGISLPIIVLNPRADNYSIMFDNRLEPEIYSFDILEEIIRQAMYNKVENYPIHLKADTGMHRLGFSPGEISRVAEILRGQNALKVKSLFSHLATADMPEMADYTNRQLVLFDTMATKLKETLPYSFDRHILNTAGILTHPEKAAEMVRLGLGLYGLPVLRNKEEEALKPVASLYTTIIAVYRRHAGDSVGYGRKGMIEKESLIATLPIGYADGLNRHLGNGGASFIVRGKECPTVGNICMDLCMIDVTDVNDVKVGDRVEIFGPEAPLPRLSDALGTIPYEIQTSISPRVKRVYFRE